MRKSLFAAGTVALALSAAGIAYAQTPEPSVTVTASVSPTKAGTSSKPKATKLKLTVKNDAASKTTAAKITIAFPSTLKISTSGLEQCKANDEALLAGPEKVCKKSIAGSGSAHALLNPFGATPAPLTFKVVPVVGKNEIIFVLSGSAPAVLHGKISGKKMTIAIPDFLQQPVPDTYSALTDLSTTISAKKGSKSLISATGCKSKKHSIGVTVGYAPNPSPPAKSSATGTGDAKCS
ncbi:hypothetical protein OM076_33110 [Solirubrobacter ginsenosidimutans]|uniref:Uncharacterized protein n=1 Tax=Solirubrobacter ginsenosidimutans TaxID=490573 RepID=A0A9X3MY67_9ACTN|nr:hypothetical protein [Solirubrobacter ginsenosidimutans]MDA0165156.1 hypothetical protein [Solirubrobacter ginsenosidimutans]